MNRSDTLDLIREAVRGLDDSLLQGETKSLEESTQLIGANGLVTSIGLVNLIMDLEILLEDRFGVSVTIADERALSQTRSPFRTIGSLADHVTEIADAER